MITRNCEHKSWFLLVNTTLLVILSTRPQRVSSASVSAPLAPLAAHHHQQVIPVVGQQQPVQAQFMSASDSERRDNFRPNGSLSSRPSRDLAQVKQTPKLTAQSTPINGNDDHEDNKQHEQGTGQMARLSSSGNPPLETNALVYLQRYGYMQAPNGAETSNNLISEESFSSAISEFQRFAGLPETGQVDNETLNVMRLPRCGNTDKPLLRTTISKSGQLISSRALARGDSDDGYSKQHSTTRQRRKRYALQGSKWRRQELTYRISQYPTKFAGGRKQEVDAQIERAFGIWSQVAPIDFVVKKEGRVHIDIRFATGDHGDGDAFDGPGNTLAHAYFPQYGGDAHFDDQEYWTVDSYAGTNIFQVAAHELGHSLGLGHSNVREALMAPFYQKYKPNFKLHLDDVLAIQALYGEKAFLPEVPADRVDPMAMTSTSTTQRPQTTSTTTSTTTTTRQFASSPSYGGGSRITPIYRGNRRPAGEDSMNTDTPPTTIVTPTDRDENNINNPDLSPNGINGFGSTETNANEPGASSPAADLCFDSTIDAITRTEDGNSYVFKGDHYWLLTDEGLALGYPRRISSDWEGLPGHLDAALTWADGKTFFFKGNKYWRFRNRQRDPGYPKLISAGFAGIPDDIDAAFVWSGNGRTYFFKGAQYWRFDSKAEPPVSSEYPRSVKVWLGVPAHINAAFKWKNNVTYFFKGNQYYRFNDREFRAELNGQPPLPRHTADWWFGCVGSNLAQRALPSASSNLATSRTARVYSNRGQLNRRTPTAALVSGAGGQFARQHDHSDWSLLAGLNADHTRSMGTHISDHQTSLPQQPPPPSSVGERNWREEDNFSELDFAGRLGPGGSPSSPSGRHDGGTQSDLNDHLEPGERRRRPTKTNSASRGDRTTRIHRTSGGDGDGLELAGGGSSSPFDRTGVQYHTNSLTGTTAISQTAHNTSNGQSSWTNKCSTDCWLSLVCSAAILCLLATVGKRNTIELYG